jgi:hypothetical protein
LAVVAAIIATVVALSSGSSGGSDPGAAATKSVGEGGGHPKSVPKSLTKPELIARADAICAKSQDSFKALQPKFPAGEETPDVAYSEELVQISTPAVEGFRALVPPVGLGPIYEQYLRSQQRVHKYDVQALRAAEAGHTNAYLAARERRDNSQRERYELARKIGFEVCSPSPE